MDENLVIPFYLNDNIIDNLYTILIEKYAKIQTVTCRKQSIVNIDTPLCNLIDGKYVDGNVHIQLLDEFQRQRTEERVSISILILLKMREMLNDLGLLKNLENSNDINGLKKNDYMEVNCILNKNPSFENAEFMLKNMQSENIFTFEGEKDIEYEQRSKMIASLEEYLNEYYDNHCIKYMSDAAFDSNTSFIIPIEKKYMHGNIDYLNDSEVKIFGKVISNPNDENNINEALKSNTCFDYFNDDKVKMIKRKYCNNSEETLEKSALQKVTKYIEILPICVYV